MYKGRTKTTTSPRAGQEKVPYQRQVRKSFVGKKFSSGLALLRALRQLGRVALTLAPRSTVVAGELHVTDSRRRKSSKLLGVV